jgi:hypothetical protein
MGSQCRFARDGSLIGRPKKDTKAKGELIFIPGGLASDLSVLPGNVTLSSFQFNAQNAPLGAGQVYLVIDTTCEYSRQSDKFQECRGFVTQSLETLKL